jgi:hypothetical protein
MNIDIEIYLTQIFTFFQKNKEELEKLIPFIKKDVFFEKVRATSYLNHKNGESFVLTKSQIIEICVELNNPKKQNDPLKNVRYFDGPFGKINLN